MRQLATRDPARQREDQRDGTVRRLANSANGTLELISAAD
jgi:hypothetical protein